MRFMHIADLHIGKQLNEVSFLPDQRQILDQIASIADAERVDCVLIAGDIYQKASPQAEAMTLFDHFVTQLTESGHKVFAISGNHDSDQRISYFASLVRGAGVYVSERFDGRVQKIALQDAYGAINVWLLPFLKPVYARRFFPEEKINACQDAMHAVLKNSPVNARERNILICHQFITGAERCDSEEISVGGLDGIDARLFDDYDYVALGHIHKPQKIGRETLRYAGSPLKYSFSESEHKKSVTIIDMQEKGDIDVRAVPLHPMRDLRVVEGRIDEILRMEPSDDYVSVTVHNEFVPPDAKLEIRTSVFPNMLRFMVSNSKTKETMDVRGAERVENLSAEQLFVDFFKAVRNGEAPTDAHMQIFERVLKELEEEQT